jgi:hypothetical protein
MGKIWDRVKLYIGAALSGGDIFDNSKIQEGISINQLQQKNQSQLLKDLLNHKVTQETQALCDRMLWVEQKSYEKGVKIINGKPQFVDIPLTYNKPNIYETNGYDAILVMETLPLSIENANINIPETYKIKDIRFEQEYPLKITREYFPKFYIETYSHKIVIKNNIEDKSKYIVELYFSIYPDMFDTKQKMFTSNIESVYNKKQSMFIIDDPKTVEFITQQAWGVRNNLLYKFNLLSYINIIKDSVYYIVQYDATLDSMEDLTLKFHSKELRDKYDKKENRDNIKIPYGVEDKPEYCEVCGKRMDDLERADYRITKQDMGIGLCQECLKKKVEAS